MTTRIRVVALGALALCVCIVMSSLDAPLTRSIESFGAPVSAEANANDTFAAVLAAIDAPAQSERILDVVTQTFTRTSPSPLRTRRDTVVALVDTAAFVLALWAARSLTCTARKRISCAPQSSVLGRGPPS